MLEKIFVNIIKVISFIVFLWIFILLFAFSDILKYNCKHIFIIKNFILIIIYIVLLFLLKYILKNKKLIKNINYDKIVKNSLPVIFLIQLYVFYHSYFVAGFDTGGIIIPSVRNILSGQSLEKMAYFSEYPNNLLLLTIYTGIMKFNSIFGIFSGNYDLMSIVTINCIFSLISSYLIYKICNKYFNKKISFFAYILSTIVITFSPWNIVCYSDSFGLIFPILLLYLYISNIEKNKKIFLIIITAFIGFKIKPQTFIIFIAIVIIEFIRLLKKDNKTNYKKIIIPILCSFCFIFLFNFGMQKIYKYENITLNKELEKGFSHFLMMGSNDKSSGVWNAEDVDISSSVAKKSDRVKKNLDVYKSRIKEYKLTGYFNFLSRKMLVNYNDGTFAWGFEGGFFLIKFSKISTISGLFRAIYYENGRLNKYYSLFMHFIWLSIITTIFINSFMQLKSKKIDYLYLVLILTLVGLTIFELLFEARARYLYSNYPIYIITFIYGLNNIINGGIKNEK